MLARRLTDSLYSEAMVLADEARSYFDAGMADGDAARLDPFDRVLFSCESLKVTTRLMHVIAWLLTQRAVDAGEMAADNARAPQRRLGQRVESDPDTVERLPAGARALVSATMDLYRRVERLDQGLDAQEAPPSPARALQGRLHRAF
jgi:regulator of CtrA degradation